MSDTINQQYIDWLSQVCNVQVSDAQLIQPLWSGYGACFRATLHYSSNAVLKHYDESSSSQESQHHQAKQNLPSTQQGGDKTALKVVVKCATPPSKLSHPKGWNGEASHNRKCQSFKVENCFYSNLQKQTDASCRTARYLGHSQQGEASLLVMEDLAHGGYSRTASSLTAAQCNTVLKWLANFHARFLNVRDEFNSRNIQLWTEGTYWNLATREDEFHAMSDGLLKQHAVAIATTLGDANYHTLVHGDAKVANFCFTNDFSNCAAVDFQYVGYGAGIKDVAYFLGSALTTEIHMSHRDALLNTYFQALEDALHVRLSNNDNSAYFKRADIALIIAEWKYLYPFACADFYRFLAGWSPDHWKIDEELRYQTDIALSMLARNG
ncbi:phosphotransferase [Alteromonas sp. S015]|uniref:phosphotransferase n=1 Tax=Alteromonas sp. S015 TaxID=3117401 RepID=UPI002FE3275E